MLSEFLSEGVHVIRSDGPEMAKIADKKLVVGKRNAAALLPISERVVAELMCSANAYVRVTWIPCAVSWTQTILLILTL